MIATGFYREVLTPIHANYYKPPVTVCQSRGIPAHAHGCGLPTYAQFQCKFFINAAMQSLRDTTYDLTRNVMPYIIIKNKKFVTVNLSVLSH